jgi:ligand-binding SRPBCC domain-containing protein
MPLIHLTTFIEAPVERVFDLSRSIDLHKKSMQQFGEEPINGRINGLLNEGEDVTWKAKHLFKTRILKVKLTSLKRPHSFIDEQVEGDFRMMKHEHVFKPIENGTIMIDLFHFETGYGFFGSLLNRFYLVNYLQTLLEERNKLIKQAAETAQWKNYLN